MASASLSFTDTVRATGLSFTNSTRPTDPASPDPHSRGWRGTTEFLFVCTIAAGAGEKRGALVVNRTQGSAVRSSTLEPLRTRGFIYSFRCQRRPCYLRTTHSGDAGKHGGEIAPKVVGVGGR